MQVVIKKTFFHCQISILLYLNNYAYKHDCTSSYWYFKN